MTAEIVRAVALISGAGCILFTACLRCVMEVLPDEASEPAGVIVLVHEGPGNQSLVRVNAKYRVVENLVARRLSLWEAAAIFREINRYPNGAATSRLPERGPLPLAHFARTEAEGLCLQVLYFVEGHIFLMRSKSESLWPGCSVCSWKPWTTRRQSCCRR